MQFEQCNQHPLSHPYQSPSLYPAANYEVVQKAEQPPLPTPVVTQPSNAPVFRRYPQETICLSCRQQVVTKMEYQISGSTWFMCCVVFFVGGFIGCCFFPFFMKSCKDAVHRCPQCNFVIGRKPLI